MIVIYIIITCIFLCAALFIVFQVERIKIPAAMLHMCFFVVFMYVLHLVNLVGYQDRKYDFFSYLMAHVVVIIYMGVFAIGVLVVSSGQRVSFQDRFYNSALSVRDVWLVTAFSCWLLVKGYLVIKYGASAFSLLRNLQGDYAIYHYNAWWETPLECYSRAIAVGACAVYIIKSVMVKDFWHKNGLVSILFFVFLVSYVGSHSAVIGPRRTLVLLAILTCIVRVYRAGLSFFVFLRLRWPALIVLFLIVIGISWYYQKIRNNFFQPDIAVELKSHDPMLFVHGFAKALVPVAERHRAYRATKFLRDGPIQIIYDVIKRRADGSSGTKGKITANAFAMIVPRVIVGGKKTELNADDFLERKMAIAPASPYLRPDVATSLLAIFIADFGFIGVLIAPAVMVIAIVAFSFFPAKGILDHPLLILFFFASIMNISANVEGNFVSILSTFRDAILLVVIIFILSFVSTFKISHNSAPVR